LGNIKLSLTGCSITVVYRVRDSVAWVQLPAPRMKPKLILFDLFGTLIRPSTKLKPEGFFAFYQKIGIQLRTKEDIELLTSLFVQLMSECANWQDLSQKLLEKTIRETDKNIVNKLANFYRENLIYQLYDDVKEVINLPYQRAILTGSAPFLFSNLDLEKHFRVFTPRETKFKKPDPQAFLYPLDKLGVKPEEAIMVGDEVERDLIPAKNLGMEAILIDRENKIENPPVKRINSLAELKKILGPVV
jgi:HAD superfamily hydrolase (TIGR01509 family)